MQRLAAKVLAGLVVFFVPLACTLIPVKMGNYFIKKGNTGKRILSCLMCFGGGVFFGTFMLHMMPEVRDILDNALIKPNHLEYPFAEFLMAAGFFVVLLVEKFALTVHAKAQIRKEKKCHDCPFVEPANDCPFSSQEMAVVNGVPKNMIDIEDLGKKLTDKKLSDCECNGDCDSETKKLSACDTTVKSENCKNEMVKVVGPDGEGMTVEEEMSHHASRSLVLVIALSLHRIFEGMSIGLKYTTLGVWNLLIAVLCHETVIGFSLGLQFVRNRFTDKRNLVYCCLVSLIMPCGVAIGTALVESGGKGTNVTLDIVNGVLQAISTGTFIYVTFFEILQDEITHADHDLGKVFSLILGFGVMAALSAVPEPEEAIPGGVNATLSALTTLSSLTTPSV